MRHVQASPLFSSPTGLAIGGFGALVSLRVSITSKKAEHALLLLGGQWTISLFLKDRAGERRRGGNESSLASLGRPQAATSISG